MSHRIVAGGSPLQSARCSSPMLRVLTLPAGKTAAPGHGLVSLRLFVPSWGAASDAAQRAVWTRQEETTGKTTRRWHHQGHFALPLRHPHRHPRCPAQPQRATLQPQLNTRRRWKRRAHASALRRWPRETTPATATHGRDRVTRLAALQPRCSGQDQRARAPWRARTRHGHGKPGRGHRASWQHRAIHAHEALARTCQPACCSTRFFTASQLGWLPAARARVAVQTHQVARQSEPPRHAARTHAQANTIAIHTRRLRPRLLRLVRHKRRLHGDNHSRPGWRIH